MPRIFSSVIITFLTIGSVYSQVLSVDGQFSKDSIKIGEEVFYSLSIKYPKTIDIVFPDSTYSFKPFEFNSKISFPTRSDTLFSFDSAVYSLTTFEIDSTQLLSLPVFMVTDGDSLAIRPKADTVTLVHVVTSIPDSIAMLENTAYSNVNLVFNYPYLVVGITVLIIGALVVLLVFGKTIRRKIALYRLKRMHERFLLNFKRAIENLGSENIDHLLGDWKRYMERLNRIPYTKLTSKEINEVLSDKQLKESLHSIDKAIYGRLKVIELPDSFDYLRRISEDSYYNRIQEIKNG